MLCGVGVGRVCVVDAEILSADVICLFVYYWGNIYTYFYTCKSNEYNYIYSSKYTLYIYHNYFYICKYRNINTFIHVSI